MRARSRLSIAALATMAMALSACGGADSTQTGGDGSGGGLTEITWVQPVPNSFAFYPFFVAQELGYFEDEGLSVEMVPARDLNPVTVVSTGQADIGSAASADLIIAAARDVGVSVIYEYYQYNAFSIVTREDSDIQSLEDLRGQTLGITAESGGEAALVRTALEDIGLDPEQDVTLLPIGEGGPQVANALNNGDVAAFSGASQDIVALDVIGIGLRDITPESLKYQPASSFVATNEWLESAGPEVVAGLCRAWAKATYAGIVNPDKVLEMAEEHAPEEANDPDYAQAMLDLSIELQTPVKGADSDFGTLRPEQWTAIVEELQTGGELAGKPDLDALLDDQYIDEANDWDRAGVEGDMAAWTK